jgi:hypothetical protein
MSVLLHGITASLGAQWYGKHVQGMMPKKQKNDV